MPPHSSPAAIGAAAWAPAFALSALGLLLALVRAAAPAGPAAAAAAQRTGLGATRLHVTNLNVQHPAAVRLELLAPTASRTLALPGLPPAHTAVVDLSEADLPGGRYAAMLLGDREAALLAEHRWPARGARALQGAPDAATAARILPWIQKAAVGPSSTISIQNPDPERTLEAELGLHEGGAEAPTLRRALTIPPRASVHLDLAGDRGFEALPEGFSGHATLRADGPVVAGSLLDAGPGTSGVATVADVDAGAAARELHAPLLYDGWSGAALDSEIVVLNAGDRSAAVILHVFGVRGTCMGESRFQLLGQLGPHEQLRASVDVEEGCAMAGRLEATQPVFAHTMVLEPGTEGSPPRRLAGYRMRRADDGAAHLALPLLRRGRAGEGGVHVTSVAEQELTAELHLFDGAGRPVACLDACRLGISPGGARRFGPEHLPEGFVGSAVITADRPVLVAALDASDDDDLGALLGIPRRGAADTGPGVTMPLAMTDRTLPTAPATETPRAGATPTATVAPDSTPSATPDFTPTPIGPTLYLPALRKDGA